MTYTASSVQEFDIIVNDLVKNNSQQHPNSSLIFRGQSNKEWNIVSSAYRYMHNSFPSINITDTVLEYFKECIKGDIDELTNIENGSLHFENEDEIMCMLQHLGGKSIFIDFSKNSHVALFFACEKYHNTQDGVVYVMRNEGEMIYNNDKEAGIYKHINLYENNPAYSRVRVQDSCFLRPFNDGIIYNNDDNITKIIITMDCKLSILENLSPDITHATVYPDIFGYIGRQRINSHTDTLKAIVFRETTQLIKDGNVKRADDALTALTNLGSIEGLSSNDYLRIKILKTKVLMSTQKFDEALMILGTIQEQYWTFQKMNDIQAHTPEQFDPIETLFIKAFEKAKCYMGKYEYEIANNFYTEALHILDNIHDEEQEKKNLRREILKQQATSLVKQNKNNLSIALDILSEIRDEENSRPDIASIYMIAERWEQAIELLRNRTDDYSLNLRANCYMELSKTGNKRIYLSKAIDTYRQALHALQQENEANLMNCTEYIPKTYDHDHHFKLAIAFEAMQDNDNARNEYETIIKSPYENEVAMHDLASLLYNKNRTDYTNIIKHYFYAIENSRQEKHPRNYNDIGRLLIDIYKTKIFPTEIKNILWEEINKIRNAEIYSENIVYELNMIIEHILNDKSDESSSEKLLLVAERLFIIADMLNRKDAFANKNIGDIYYIKYSSPSINERNRREFAEKALKRYILAHSYYLIENKICKIIDEKISELEDYLKREILLIQE